MDVQNLIEKSTCQLGIFFPPAAHCAHIVGGGRHHRQIRRISGLEKSDARFFGHALYFKAQNTQPFHHAGHTIGHQSQILATNEHFRRFFQVGQLLHRLFFPEIILFFVKIMQVQLVKRRTLTQSGSRMRTIFHTVSKMIPAGFGIPK